MWMMSATKLELKYVCDGSMAQLSLTVKDIILLDFFALAWAYQAASRVRNALPKTKTASFFIYFVSQPWQSSAVERYCSDLMCWRHPWQLASEKLGCSCVHHNFCRCTCLFLSIPAFDSLELLSVGIMIHESIFRLCGWCSWATNSTIEGGARWNWRPSCAHSSTLTNNSCWMFEGVQRNFLISWNHDDSDMIWAGDPQWWVLQLAHTELSWIPFSAKSSLLIHTCNDQCAARDTGS